MLKNLKEFYHDAYIDNRGYYWTSWKISEFKNIKFNHDKFSISKKNVLRGLHGDYKTWKLISCVYGKIFFVVVNYDKKSNDYLKYKKIILSHENRKQILLPPGFANGMLCLSKVCVIHYKLSYKGQYTDADKQFSIKWNDKRINIKWPIKKPILSQRDS